MESAESKIFDRRCRRRQSKQTFWSHNNERSSLALQNLTAQKIKILRRCCRVCDLKIVLTTKLDKSFQASARMLRALSFVSMWKQQNKARFLSPFFFTSRNKLVDDSLCAICEIAKLRFPNNEIVLSDNRISILETHPAFFGKRAVDYFECTVPSTAPPLEKWRGFSK